MLKLADTSLILINLSPSNVKASTTPLIRLLRKKEIIIIIKKTPFKRKKASKNLATLISCRSQKVTRITYKGQ